MIVGGRVADVVGGKWVYGGGLFLSSILSIFTPLLLRRRGDAWAAFGLRIAQGCLHGVTFPALHAMTVRWTTEGGRGLFVAKVGFLFVYFTQRHIRGVMIPAVESIPESDFGHFLEFSDSDSNSVPQLS